MPKGIFISVVYACLPLIWKGFIMKDESYNFRENWYIFAVQWMPMFLYKLFNYILIMMALIVLQMKLEFKKQIIAMINPNLKYTHKVTPILPELLEASSSNI